MQQVKWFERKFDFDFQQNIFPSIIERLRGTPILLNHKVAQTPTPIFTQRDMDKWSMQEHLGHLLLLEPLWQGRLQDVLNGEEYLREADLSNTATQEANFNQQITEKILEEFVQLRSQTISQLEQVTEAQIYHTALHPRLMQPMRIMDLFLFVAEHDDHHLAAMSNLSIALGF